MRNKLVMAAAAALVAGIAFGESANAGFNTIFTIDPTCATYFIKSGTGAYKCSMTFSPAASPA